MANPTEESEALSIPHHIVTEFFPPTSRREALYRSLTACSSQCLAIVPHAFAHTPEGCDYPTCTTYVLCAGRTPTPSSFFPLIWEYASGYTMVELEPVLDDASGLRLTEQYFLTNTFTQKVSAFAAHVRGENGYKDTPGFVLQDTLKSFETFASKLFAEDPLLRTYNPNYLKSEQCSRLKLQPNDYMYFGCSDWSTASQETKSLSSHKETERHFYLCLKYKLPIESVDQIRILLYQNPQSDTWKKLVDRKVFQRIHELAHGIRVSMVEKTLKYFGLVPKKSNPHLVDTMYNVFDSTIVKVRERNGNEEEGVVYHAGCTGTHLSSLGVVSEVCSSERDAGWLWLHGPSSSRIGGLHWPQVATSNSLPVVTGPSGRITKKHLDSYASMGWEKTNGYVKITPLIFI